MVLAWNCLGAGQALPCTWCNVCPCHADGKQLRSFLLCYLGLGLVRFGNLGILEIHTRSESEIVSLFKKQNKLLLKRGGQELPSVWKTLSQETCRGAQVVPGMSLEEAAAGFSSADSEFTATPELLYRSLYEPVLLSAM